MPTTDEQQEAELKELEQLYPPPADAEWIDDHFWLAEQTFKPDWNHREVNVAVMDKRVLGVGPDYLELRLRLAREYGVHPRRIVVSWIGSPWS